MKSLRGLVLRLVLVAAMLVGGLFLYGEARRHPEDLPWTKLDLSRPIGLFTGAKLAALDARACRTLLDGAGIAFAAVPDRSDGPQCRMEMAVRPTGGGAARLRYHPEGLAAACPVVAALALWEWHVVQPAALRHFGEPVVGIDHLGSYSCRRLYGREDGAYSEHATGNAVDIAAFRLAGGRRISLLRDWDNGGPEGRFLDEVRDGACRLFATTLSPDYNSAHRDHLHLDLAARGRFGRRACR